MTILSFFVIFMHVLLMKLCNNSLIKKTKCLKNPEYFSCTYLILINKPRSFQTKCVVGEGLSDFHTMTIFLLKKHFRKIPLKVISYRDVKKLDSERFMNFLQFNLREESTDYSKNPEKFFEIFHTLLSTHASKKKRYIYVRTISLLLLKPFLNLSCKEHVLETNL